jgi:sulfate-transporting ATPase
VTEPFRFALLGLGTGGLYVLVALGLVLVYRGSGVVNFAQGAIGMVGTYFFWELRTNHGWATPPAAIAGILFSAVVGVLIHILVMRPLRNASQLTKLIATLGVLSILQAAAALRYHAEATVVTPFLPHGVWKVLGAPVGQDQMIIFFVVLAMTAVLYAVYRYTAFGLATTAVADNRRAASGIGLSPNLIAGANWAIGGALAAVAGILLVPITGLQVTQLTLLVIPSLAAAVVGNMSSFPITLAAGLLIGVVQSEVTRYVNTPGADSTVPFIVMAIVLIARGRSVAGRGEQAARLPSIGSGRIRPLVIVVLGGLTFAALWLWLSPEWIDALNTQLIMGVILLSIIVVTGYAGQLSLAQFAFAGFGALFAGRLAQDHHIPFILALVVGALVTIPLGVVVGLAGVRTRGVNLAIITLGLAVALQGMVFTNAQYTGGIDGTRLGTPKLFGLNIGAIVYPERYGTVALVLFVLIGIAVANLRRGRVGRRLIAVRSNESAAASLGISVIGAKLYAFSLAGVIAGIGGVLVAFRNPSVDYSTFDVFRSIQLVLDAVVGGVAWIAGALLGASLEAGSLGAHLLDAVASGWDQYLFLIGGVLVVLTLLRAPDGLAALNHELGEKIAGLLHRRKERAVKPVELPLAQAREKVVPKRLVVETLTVRFGGVQALSNLSLNVEPGEIVGLIGPNGSGKTTTIEAITGFVRPVRGHVELDGESIDGWSRERRARAGMTRSFQALELFDDMTVLENIQAASERRDLGAYLATLVYPGKAKVTAAAAAAIREFGLENDLRLKPTQLPYGRRRLVAIARAVAMEPSVILLDEPAAGLDERESRELGELIGRLASDWGMGVLLIEHDVSLVMSTCHRIYALDFGLKIAEGTPEEIRQSPEVIAAYLGDAEPAPIQPDQEPAAEDAPADAGTVPSSPSRVAPRSG